MNEKVRLRASARVRVSTILVSWSNGHGPAARIAEIQRIDSVVGFVDISLIQTPIEKSLDK